MFWIFTVRENYSEGEVCVLTEMPLVVWLICELGSGVWKGEVKKGGPNGYEGGEG